MAERFKIELDGQTYEIDEDSFDGALAAAEQIHAQIQEENRIAKNKAFFGRVQRDPMPSTDVRSFPINPPAAPGGGFLGVPASQIQETARGGPPTQENPDRQLKIDNAAQAGVDVHTGLEPAIRGVVQLLDFDKEVSGEVLEDALRKEYGDNLEIPEGMNLVFQEESSGEKMYLRMTPEGRLRPTLINPPGADMGDVYEIGGELPTIALETIGGIAGAAIGGGSTGGAGTYVGGVAGATALGAMSIPLREALARKFGAPDELVDKIKTGDEAAFQALMSGSGEALGFAVEGGTTALRNFFGRPLDIDDLPALEREIQNNLRKVDELRQRTGQDVNMSLGELTGDPDILVAEANIKNQQAGVTARHMRADEIRADKAARQALNEMTYGAPRAPTDGGFRSAESVSDSVRETLVGAPTDQMSREQVRAADELTNAEFSMRQDASWDNIVKLRDDLHAKAQQLSLMEDAAWTEYRKAIRWDPETRTSGVLLDNRGPTAIKQVATRLAQDESGALLRSLQNARRASLENMGFNPQQIDQVISTDQLAGLAQETLDPFHVHMALSHMKKQLRAVQNGSNPDGWEVSDMVDIIEALEGSITGPNAMPMLSARNPNRALAESTAARVRSSWDEANHTSAILHETLDTNNMRTLLQVRPRVTEGRETLEFPNMPPGMIRNRLFAPDDPRMLTEALDALDWDPKVRVTMINEMNKKYADTVLQGGKFNQRAHNQFMDSHEGHLRVLGIEGQIDNVAQFGRQYDQAKFGLEVLEKRLGEFYGRNVADMTKPLSIADEILSDRVKPGQAGRLIRDLDKMDPALGAQVRDKILESLHGTLTSRNGMVINPGTLDTMLKTNRDTLTAVMGREYVKDLDALHDVMKLMGERAFARSTKELMQTHFVSITRSLFGPLSKKQRFLTAVQRVARSRRSGTVNGLLRDPNALRSFVRLKNLSIRDPRYWGIVQGLGLLDYALDSPALQQAYEDFQNGTLAEEQRRLQEPRRIGTIL